MTSKAGVAFQIWLWVHMPLKRRKIINALNEAIHRYNNRLAMERQTVWLGPLNPFAYAPDYCAQLSKDRPCHTSWTVRLASRTYLRLLRLTQQPLTQEPNEMKAAVFLALLLSACFVCAASWPATLDEQGIGQGRFGDDEFGGLEVSYTMMGLHLFVIADLTWWMH